MTYRGDFTLPAKLLEQVSQQGLDILPELIQVIVNNAMLAERQQHINAEPYQRTLEREAHDNSYKPKTMRTRVGDAEEVKAFYYDLLNIGRELGVHMSAMSAFEPDIQQFIPKHE